MQININKTHFYVLSGLLIFLVVITIFSFKGNGNLTGALISGGNDDSSYFGHDISEISGAENLEKSTSSTSNGKWPDGHYCILLSVQQGNTESDGWDCNTALDSSFKATSLVFDNSIAGDKAVIKSEKGMGKRPENSDFGAKGEYNNGYFQLKFCCK